MRDGSLFVVSIAKHCLKLLPKNFEPIQFVACADRMGGIGGIFSKQGWITTLLRNIEMLNAVSKGYSNHIPWMEECIASHEKAAVLSILKTNCVKWKVDIEETDRNKTELRVHHGLYRFVQMRFGLKPHEKPFSAHWMSICHQWDVFFS